MERTGVEDQPDLPDYAGACISNVVPALLEPPADTPSWLPAVAADASQVVLLVLDGLGWDQLQERRHIAPTLAAMAGGFIHTVAPSTTAAALTSIATGLPPGEHVAAADASLGADQSGALERQQDLLEVGLGQTGALGDVPDRRGSGFTAVQRQRQQCSTCVVATGRHPHGRAW